jgi:outer membrane lipoprotein-sorting protein
MHRPFPLEERPMILRILFLSAGLAALSGTVSAMTAEELVAKNLDARGGATKLRSITSIHRVGKVRTGGGLDAKIESWAIAPDSFRGEFSLQGMTAVQAWDGHQAWSISPFQGRREPQKLSPDDAKALVEQSDIAGPLVDYQAKGNKIEYLGTEDIDGTDAHKLRVTLKNGDTEVLYLDPDQFLEIRVVNHRMVRGQEEVSTTDLGEYEKVDGIYFPFESGRNHIEKVELNQPIDKNLFAFPGGTR